MTRTLLITKSALGAGAIRRRMVSARELAWALARARFSVRAADDRTDREFSID
jgi:hypothetical protein